MKLRVAACQVRTSPDPSESAGMLLPWMERAAGDGVDIISFPEACLCNYTCDPEYWMSADPAAFRAAESRVQEAARALDIAVILGTVHWRDDEVFNSVLVIDRDGAERGRYAKTHLAEDWSTPGDTLPIYSVAGVPSCFAVCHDIRYPEVIRLPAIRGAQICYFCSNESGLLEEYKMSAYRAMPISRAAENAIFLVMANAPADPDHMRSDSQSHGNSRIIHPDGNVLKEAGHFEQTLVTATIETDDADRIYAQRAVTDPTLLRDWMTRGTQLVEEV